MYKTAYGGSKYINDKMSKPWFIPSEPNVTFVSNGLIPPANSLSQDRTLYSAGVYDQGLEVVECSLLYRGEENVTVPYAVNFFDETEIGKKNETVVYGGMLDPHFGHFLLESTTRLWWPLLNNFSGKIVFQKIGHASFEIEHINTFFSLLQLDQQIEIAENVSRYTKIIVPCASLRSQKWVYPQYNLPFARIGDMVRNELKDQTSRNYYISRSRLPEGRVYGEEVVEAFAHDAGFQHVYPEENTFFDQIKIFSSADHIMGIVGSAFHMIPFMRDCSKITLLAREDLNTDFIMIGEAMNVAANYIMCSYFEKKNFGLRGPYIIDAGLAIKLSKISGIKSGEEHFYSRCAVKSKFLSEWYRIGAQESSDIQTGSKGAVINKVFAILLYSYFRKHDICVSEDDEQLSRALLDLGMLDEAVLYWLAKIEAGYESLASAIQDIPAPFFEHELFCMEVVQSLASKFGANNLLKEIVMRNFNSNLISPDVTL